LITKNVIYVCFNNDINYVKFSLLGTYQLWQMFFLSMHIHILYGFFDNSEIDFSQIHKEKINRQVEELLERGIVKPSQSPYNTPIWIVLKKEDSKGNKCWRMVLDFRTLNDKTISDAYPLLNIVDISNQLGEARYFSVCDLASGFYQIKMDPADNHKTAFTIPFGHYEFDRMPFGLKNTSATFQRLMDLALYQDCKAKNYLFIWTILSFMPLHWKNMRENIIC